ncbi:hypothetical protein GCM10009552_39700 [Rothia nasimurium]
MRDDFAITDSHGAAVTNATHGFKGGDEEGYVREVFDDDGQIIVLLNAMRRCVRPAYVQGLANI